MKKREVVIAIAPTSRGFGFVVCTAPNSNGVLDWGVKEIRSDKNLRSKAQIGAMLADIKPTAVVIENWVHVSCRRSERVRTLLVDVAVLAQKSGATAYPYSRHHVRHTFKEAGRSKDAIAAAIAESLRPLKPWLPPRRHIWESEKHSMAIFEAAALALTHFAVLREAREAQTDLVSYL